MPVKRDHEVCLVCGKPSLKVICVICAQKLNNDARHDHVRHEQEKLHS